MHFSHQIYTENTSEATLFYGEAKYNALCSLEILSLTILYIINHSLCQINSHNLIFSNLTRACHRHRCQQLDSFIHYSKSQQLVVIASANFYVSHPYNVAFWPTLSAHSYFQLTEFHMRTSWIQGKFIVSDVEHFPSSEYRQDVRILLAKLCTGCVYSLAPKTLIVAGRQ